MINTERFGLARRRLTHALDASIRFQMQPPAEHATDGQISEAQRRPSNDKACDQEVDIIAAAARPRPCRHGDDNSECEDSQQQVGRALGRGHSGLGDIPASDGGNDRAHGHAADDNLVAILNVAMHMASSTIRPPTSMHGIGLAHAPAARYAPCCQGLGNDITCASSDAAVTASRLRA